MILKYSIILFLLHTVIFSNEIERSDFFKFNKEQVEAYHNSISNQSEIALKKLLESQFFINTETILDIGCGDGKATALLAKKLPHICVLGCDVSKSMIEFAVKKYAPFEFSNLSFIEKNAMDLGFSNKFDRVISINCLHWTKDQKVVLNEIFTSLKSGGKAFIVTSPKCVEDDFQNICSELISSSKWNLFFQNYESVHSFHTQEEYQTMLVKTGFVVGKIEPMIHEVLFEDKPSLEILLKATLTPLYHLSESHRNRFLQDLFDLLEKKGRIDLNGKIHLRVAQIQLLIMKF